MKSGVHRKAKGRGWVFRWKEQSGATVVRRTSPEYPTKRLAEVARDAIAQRIQDMAVVRRSHSLGLLMTWNAVLDRWRKSRRADDGVTEAYAATVHRVLKQLGQQRQWTSVAAITAAEVDAWRSSNGGTGRRTLSYLKAVLRYAQKILRQPIDAGVLGLPIGSSRADPPELLTPDEVATISRAAHAIAHRFGVLIDCLATYGWRPIEACRLTCGDLSGDTLTRRQTKNGRTVAHALLPAHAQSLRDLIGDRPGDAPMFTSPRGIAWTISSAGSAAELAVWYRRNAAADLPTARRGIYLLKDYAISRMESLGIDDRTKATFTGHADLRSFDHYKATNRKRTAHALAKIGGTDGGTQPTGA